MIAPIAEDTAWDLVRAVPVGLDGAGERRVHHPDAPEEVWLRVDSSARWEASGPVTDAARDVFDLYLPLQVQADLVIAQMGQSLDGRIATESGHSQYVTGPADIRRLHRLRALVDAVIVGAGTVAADDPRLTVRECAGDDPVRVILDPDGRVDPDSEIFAAGAARTIVVRRSDVGEDAGAPDGGRAGRVETPGGHIIELPIAGPSGFDPHAVLAALREEGLGRVLIEGGGITVSRFLQAGALHRLHITVAPVLFGSGRPSLTLDPIDTIDQALRPRCRVFALGDDLLYDLEFA